AITSVCGSLRNGQDASCVTPPRRYYQQAVLINRGDILEYEINTPTAENPECVYNVGFTLKPGTTGYLFAGSENGSIYKGYFAKSTSPLGQPQYAHTVDMLVVGADEEAKCVLDAVSKGSYVVALQIGDIIEIFGMESGLAAGDFTYDLTEGGGGAQITLSSLEVAPEGRVPLVYVSENPGSEIADFDSLFANDAPSV